MVTRLQLEARVLAVFDAVKSGTRVEDGLLELKSDWPEPEPTARRLAGHANAARGEDILWIVGLDETAGVTQPRAVELADWWAQVRTCFDDVAPTITDLVVHTEDGALQVLLFDTSLGPFVVRNAVYGKTGGGCVEWEIPWRDGTAVRSAHRADLVRMLAPVARLPEIEVLNASASARTRPPERPLGQAHHETSAIEHLAWYFYFGMYVIPVMGEFVVLPLHRTRFELAVEGEPYVLVDNADSHYYAPSSTSFAVGRFESIPDTASVDATSAEAIIHLPGRLNFRARRVEPTRELRPTATIRLRFTVQPIHTERSIQLEIQLTPTPADRDGTLNWAFGS